MLPSVVVPILSSQSPLFPNWETSRHPFLDLISRRKVRKLSSPPSALPQESSLKSQRSRRHLKTKPDPDPLNPPLVSQEVQVSCHGATRHFDAFLNVYEERYQPRYGILRPIIPEVVNKFLDCGDLERGFARVRCDHCKHEYLLAFSCIRLRPRLRRDKRGAGSARRLARHRHDDPLLWRIARLAPASARLVSPTGCSCAPACSTCCRR